MFKNVIIVGTGIYYPEKNEKSREEIVNHFKAKDIEVDGLLTHLGKERRFIADNNETPLTIAYNAVKEALKNSNVSIEDIDMLVFSTDTPEYTIPSNAVQLANMFNVKKIDVLYDINANCAGGVVALDQVSSFMKSHSQIKKALVVGSFMGSYIHDENEAISYSIFTDGAAAAVLETKEEDFERGFIDSEYDANADYHNANSFPKNGFNDIIKNTASTADSLKLYVNPTVQLSFVPDVWEKIVRNLLERNSLKPHDVESYICSQFSLFDINSTLDRLNVDHDKSIYTGDKYGYTGSSSPLFALNHALKNNIIKSNTYGIFLGIGAGYTSVSVLYKY